MSRYRIRKLKSTYPSLLDGILRKVNKAIWGDSVRLDYYRARLSASEELDKNGDTIFYLTLLCTDADINWVILDLKLNFGDNKIYYSSYLGDNIEKYKFDNEQEILAATRELIEDYLEKVPVDFENIYWVTGAMSNQKFVGGLLVRENDDKDNLLSTSLLFHTGKDYSDEGYVLSSAADISSDALLHASWKKWG